MTFLAAVVSCTSTRVETDDVPQGGVPIRLSFQSDEPGTRAMLNADSFQTKGNALQVWDVYFSDIQEPTAYLDGKYVVSDGNAAGSVWPFRPSVTETSVQDHYYWTKTGIHRFYGVLVNDNSTGASLAPAADWGFDADNKIYSVPTTTLDLESEQFDFVYSNVIERDLDNGGTTAAVPLNFKHIFTAFGFTLTNDSPSDLKLTDVSLSIVNTGSAKIDYTSAWRRKGEMTAPQTTYTLSNVSSIQGIADGTTSQILASSECRDLFKGDVLTSDGLKNYMAHTLMWPQELTGRTLNVSYEATVNKEVEEEMPIYSYNYRGNYYLSFTTDLDAVAAGDMYKSKDYKRVYDYSARSYVYSYAGRGQGTYAIAQISNNSFTGAQRCNISGYETVTKIEPTPELKDLSVPLADITPGGRWNAGNRYLYNLVYSDNEIGLTVTVMKWDGGHGGDVTFE